MFVNVIICIFAIILNSNVLTKDKIRTAVLKLQPNEVSQNTLKEVKISLSKLKRRTEDYKNSKQRKQAVSIALSIRENNKIKIISSLKLSTNYIFYSCLRYKFSPDRNYIIVPHIKFSGGCYKMKLDEYYIIKLSDFSFKIVTKKQLPFYFYEKKWKKANESRNENSFYKSPDGNYIIKHLDLCKSSIENSWFGWNSLYLERQDTKEIYYVCPGGMYEWVTNNIILVSGFEFEGKYGSLNKGVHLIKIDIYNSF